MYILICSGRHSNRNLFLQFWSLEVLDLGLTAFSHMAFPLHVHVEGERGKRKRERLRELCELCDVSSYKNSNPSESGPHPCHLI